MRMTTVSLLKEVSLKTCFVVTRVLNKKDKGMIVSLIVYIPDVLYMYT